MSVSSTPAELSKNCNKERRSKHLKGRSRERVLLLFNNSFPNICQNCENDLQKTWPLEQRGQFGKLSKMRLKYWKPRIATTKLQTTLKLPKKDADQSREDNLANCLRGIHRSRCSSEHRTYCKLECHQNLQLENVTRMYNLKM